MNGSIALKKNRHSRRASARSFRRSNLMAAILIFSIVTIVVFSLYKTAQADDSVSLNKYYRSVVIQSEDTLWNLAETYYTGSEQSTSACVKEIKEINRIGSDRIEAGMKLIIPFYGE